MSKPMAVIGALTMTVIAHLALAQESRTIDFEGRSWKPLQADRIAVAEYRGRSAVHVTGTNLTSAYLPGSAFQEGTIEVDLSASGRATPGIGFGGFAAGNWRNRVLFNHWRPGREASERAVLEQAVITRRDGTVVVLNLRDAAHLQTSQRQPGWFHVRITVRGDSLAVFLDNEETPIITLGSVVEQGSGEIGLCGSDFHFANFVFTPAH
jgi:hypothetical protein